MKDRFLIILVKFIIFSQALTAQAHSGLRGNGFISNRGQWPDEVLAHADLPGLRLFVQTDGLRWVAYQNDGCHGGFSEKGLHGVDPSRHLRGHAWEQRFPGAHAQRSTMLSSDSLNYPVHYLQGSQPEKWAQNLYPVREMRFPNFYPGIDWVLHMDGEFKYEFHVKPGADPEQIRMQVRGVPQSLDASGRLVYKAQIGDYIEEAPVSWTLKSDGLTKVPVASAWVQKKGHWAYRTGPYAADEVLVLDPRMIGATYSGSGVDNWGFTATYDNAGNMYLGGIAIGPGYPTTLGAFGFAPGQNQPSGNPIFYYDVTLTKYSPNGGQVLFSTYLGGLGQERPSSLIFDENAQSLLVFGRTNSANFPITAGAYQPALSGSYDLFVTRLSSTGSLLASTYLGGSGAEGTNSVGTPYTTSSLQFNYGDDSRGEVVVAPNGDVLLVSNTQSANFPVTSVTGTLQATFGGSMDGVVARLSPNLNQLLFSTYLGGGSMDATYAIKPGGGDTVFVAGATFSQTTFFPNHARGYDLSHNGQADGYVMMMRTGNPPFSQPQLVSLTYCGTTSYDQNFLLERDNRGHIYVAGVSMGNINQSGTRWFQAGAKHYIQKYSPFLDSLYWSAPVGLPFLNGVPQSAGPALSLTAFLVDRCGKIYLSGWGGDVNSTFNSNIQTMRGLPITANALQPGTTGSDMYLLVLAPDADTLVYATYLGGSISEEHVDGGTSRFSPEGIVYHAVCAGCRGNSDFPVTSSAVYPFNQSTNCNALIFKLDLELVRPRAGIRMTPSDTNVCVGSPVRFENTGTTGSSVWWTIGTIGQPPVHSAQTSSTQYTFTTPGTYRVRLVVEGCLLYDTVQQDIFVTNTGISILSIINCLGDTSSVTISHPALTRVANASLRMTYNPDSLTYVGFNSLNPAFSGMTISGGNGSVLMDWNTSSNQTIAAGNMVNLRFRVNGNSSLSWDTTQFPCEFSDVNFNVVPQTYVSGSISQNTQRLTWNRDICQGQSFALGNQSYTTSGTYQGRLTGTGGACDTLITLNLNVIPTQTILPAVTTCSNQPYSFNGLSLSTSGTYLDTLINSLGCDSILQLNLTVNPAYNQNQSVVICTGTTYSFGGQNLTASGTYSHTYTTANGCDSSVQLNLSVADSVSIQSTNGSNGFCPGGSLRIGLANPIPNVTYQWSKDGSIISGANSDSLVVSQSGVYQLTVQVSPTCSVTSNTLTISVLNCNRITGDLKYDNNNQTPLAGVPVHLKTLLGNMVASDTTDATGGYEMSGYNNGNYVLDANVNYVPGGINSTDALQVTRFFTSLITLSPLRVKAGDVNGNNITNSADALLINRRITGLLSAFGVGGFVNSLPSVNAAGNPLQGNLRVLSTGDVNGTYNPLPLAPALELDTVYGNGNVGTAVVRFTTAGSGVFERGIVWSSSPNPTLTSNKSIAGTGGFGFTHSFSSIDPNNIQYARAYARTSAGVYYSQERSFTPIPGLRCLGTPTVTDIDGNTYYTVQIGNQCWTQSNLKVSKYRNGDSIPTGLSNTQWGQWGLTTLGAYSIYNNDPVNDGLYGKLYNHYAVTDSRGLCPTGWHVPTDGEWNVLVKYLDPNADTACVGCWQSPIAGGALKSTAMQPTPGGWNAPNAGATNSSGFTAPPGGLRFDNGDFYFISSAGFWWSSSVSDAYFGWFRSLYSSLYSDGYILRGDNDRAGGFSVRCVKNTLPQVNTTSVTNVTPSTALVTGEVISEGDQNTTRGFCYSTTSNPTLSNDTTMNGTGIGAYSDTLQNLTPSTIYYVRAYATNSLGTSYGNELNFTTDSIRIGSNYAGGIVFYIDSTGQHGLVCAPSDQGVYEWCEWATHSIAGTSINFGTGQVNTALIVSGSTLRPNAASVCDDLVLNAYTDWFLPSLEELQLIYFNLHLQNLGGFNGTYWSSSQAAAPWGWAFAQDLNFISGQIGGGQFNGATRLVRAVRIF